MVRDYCLILFLTLLCFSSADAKSRRAAPITKPYLIVPGHSIGKVLIGMNQEAVHQVIGVPHSCNFITFRNKLHGDKEIKDRFVIDIWKRGPRSGYAECGYDFEVIYHAGKVFQITISGLNLYRTSHGLSLRSRFDQFAQSYGTPLELTVNYDPDPPFGASLMMRAYWDFRAEGISIESNYFGGANDPDSICKLSVHAPNTTYLFQW